MRLSGLLGLPDGQTARTKAIIVRSGNDDVYTEWTNPGGCPRPYMYMNYAPLMAAYNFALFLFCGLLPWTWFQASLHSMGVCKTTRRTPGQRASTRVSTPVPQPTSTTREPAERPAIV